MEASDSNFYGTTERGGLYGGGTMFRMSLDGAVTTLYSFGEPNGPAIPNAPLIQASDGYLYGTSHDYGAEGAGTIFRLTLDGTMTVLKSFSYSGPDGANPGGLLEGMDGKLYGTTATAGGAQSGTAFAITTEGTFTLVHTFLKKGKVGYQPSSGTLVQGADGSLYGGTNSGGVFGYGAVYRITLDGKVADLRAFDPSRDGYSDKTLVRSADGRLYGAAYAGGEGGGGTLFALGEKPVRATAPRAQGR